jgi:hypothetical protein
MIGNSSTSEILRVLTANAASILSFIIEPNTGLLALRKS